jgi:hypothetical protein
MKRNIALVLGLVMAIIFVFAGCSSSSNTGETAKTGLAVISSIAKSVDAGEKDGLAEVDSTVAAVIVDKDGKILNCRIDGAQTKINFTTAGKLTTPLDTAFKSKQELGAEYGLGKASGIKKEWNEQADAFAKYVTGKTAAEVKGIAVTAEGVAADKDLSSSVTIHIGDFIAVVDKAVSNAKDLGAKSGDKLGLGVLTSISGSKEPADEDGLAQAYTNYTAATFAADSKITSSLIDASQTNVNFSKEGKITSDLKAELKTKQELGAAYGMIKASSIKKEWNEQADAFAKYVTGKTVAEVKGIAVTAEGTPSDKDLASSVTIHIGDYETIIEKASGNAK